MNVGKYPIGITSRARKLNRLLQSQKSKDNVRMIGLYGMGGLGKSTLPKEIYNLIFQKFESRSFIEITISDVLEGRQNGIVKLQEKLLSDIYCDYLDDGDSDDFELGYDSDDFEFDRSDFSGMGL